MGTLVTLRGAGIAGPSHGKLSLRSARQLGTQGGHVSSSGLRDMSVKGFKITYLFDKLDFIFVSIELERRRGDRV